MFLQVDIWLWSLEPSHAFSVQSVYKNLTSQPPIDLPVDASSLWHKDVPLKVVLFAWRLFRDRLPTKDNLHRCGVIDHTSTLCVSGCGSIESSNHLFLHCNFFGSVWYFIYRWIGVSAAVPFYVPDHFNQFTLSGAISQGAPLHYSGHLIHYGVGNLEGKK